MPAKASLCACVKTNVLLHILDYLQLGQARLTHYLAEVLQIGAEKRNGAVDGRKAPVNPLEGRMRSAANGHAKSEDSDDEVMPYISGRIILCAACTALPSFMGRKQGNRVMLHVAHS